jgi:hypothetical protein
MRTIAPIMMIFVSLVAVQVTSARAREGMNPSTIRREISSDRWIKVKGQLICDNASGSTACQLNLKDSKSGQIYTLTETDQALELFNSGTKSVLIEGRANGRMLAINEISAL